MRDSRTMAASSSGAYGLKRKLLEVGGMSTTLTVLLTSWEDVVSKFIQTIHPKREHFIVCVSCIFVKMASGKSLEQRVGKPCC